MAEYLHVYISPKLGVSYSEVENKMNLADDWLRYGNDKWIIYTTSDEEVWNERLMPLVEPKGSLFICKLILPRSQGWMTSEFWDWINAKRD